MSGDPKDLATMMWELAAALDRKPDDNFVGNRGKWARQLQTWAACLQSFPPAMGPNQRALAAFLQKRSVEMGILPEVYAEAVLESMQFKQELEART